MRGPVAEAAERASAGWRATIALLSRLPQPALSRAFGRLARVPLPPAVRRPVLLSFARFAGIDLSEVEHSIESFPTLDAFFVRTLRPGLRSWPVDALAAGSPVDGVVGALGRVDEGTLLQAKGRRYSAAALLDDTEAAARYEGGAFLTIYLSPRHYHRVHAPVGDVVVRARHVPGRLLPVNEAAVLEVPSLFPRNERLIADLAGPLGRTAVIAVGAYNVGRISASFDAHWGGAAPEGGITNRAGVVFPETRVYDPPVPMPRGEELMAFHLGSTVVLLFERDVTLEPLRMHAEIRLGETVARTLRGTSSRRV